MSNAVRQLECGVEGCGVFSELSSSIPAPDGWSDVRILVYKTAQYNTEVRFLLCERCTRSVVGRLGRETFAIKYAAALAEAKSEYERNLRAIG